MEAGCAQHNARQATRPTIGRAPSVRSRTGNSGQVQPPETMATQASSQESTGQSPSGDSRTADSQAQSASSILVTRSTQKAQVIDPGLLVVRALSARPRPPHLIARLRPWPGSPHDRRCTEAGHNRARGARLSGGSPALRPAAPRHRPSSPLLASTQTRAHSNHAQLRPRVPQKGGSLADT